MPGPLGSHAHRRARFSRTATHLTPTVATGTMQPRIRATAPNTARQRLLLSTASWAIPRAGVVARGAPRQRSRRPRPAQADPAARHSTGNAERGRGWTGPTCCSSGTCSSRTPGTRSAFPEEDVRRRRRSRFCTSKGVIGFMVSQLRKNSS